MKLHRSSLSIALFFLVALFAVAWQTQTAQGAALQQSSFSFPGDGQRNNNRTIGDYCCTGETATVRTTNGDAVGYIYFYDFSGS